MQTLSNLRCEVKSKKTFLITTLIMIAALSSVVACYAKSTAEGASTVQGTVTYSPDNTESETWSTTLTLTNASNVWYSRLEISSSGFNKHVTLIWQLQQKTDFSSWTDISGATITTSVMLSGCEQNIYATSNGAYCPDNFEWGQYATISGTYRITATMMS